MKIDRVIISIATSALITANVMADTNSYEIGVAAGYNGTSNSKLEDNHVNYNGRIAKRLDEAKNWLIRLEGEGVNDVDYKRGGDTDLRRALLNATYEFSPEDDVWTPYLFGGAGYQKVQHKLYGYDNGALGDFGAGIKYHLNKTMDLFAEARYLKDFENEDNHYGIMAGVSFPFGNISKPEPVAATTVPVMRKPLPLPSLDKDGDGVLDTRDKCPNTPAGTIVDNDGCPLNIDSDNDGVPNYLDKCPTTPKGFKVDSSGCATSFTMFINFDTDSAKIPSAFYPKIEKLANFLKEHPNSKVILKGYTDNTGTSAYNLRLSLKRAKAVKKALIEKGIDALRISTEGLGENNPIASNDTPEGRAKNRRIEAIIVPMKR
ncbi:OmpA family protein [Hydrogenimonas sp.]